MTWTTERRQKQSEAIRTWKPWDQSTGPKTTEGKMAVSRNAWKGGHRTKLRELIRLVNEEIKQSQRMVEALQC